MHKFPPGHAQIKALIAQCAESGVEIESLPEYGGHYPRFRFVPVENPVLHDGKPSGRGLVSAGARNPHKVRNWSPAKLSLNPMYDCPMKGDHWKLDEARRAWHRGNPVPLREHLARLAAGERFPDPEYENGMKLADPERLAA